MQSYSRHVRWAVPAVGVAAVAAVTVGSLISVASAAPALPPRTPGQLLAAVAGIKAPPPPFTGQVDETASLGLPQLPGVGNQNSITSLLTGSHTVTVFYGGPKQIRLQVPVPLGETDLIRNGTTAWLWQSSSNSVTKYTLPAHGTGSRPSSQPAPAPTGTPLTPQQAAQRVLAVVGKTTTVRVDSNVSVAGQDAYQLVLAPKQSGSLIGRVTIALDGQHPQVPLRVQVFARGASSPAFQVGYNSISFVTPAGTNFNFTPPHGATVHSESLPGGTGGNAGTAMPGSAAAPQVIGKDWLSVAVLPSSALSGLAGSGNAAAAAGQAAQSATGTGSGPSGSEVLGALLKTAAPVHGAWGSGKLLRTSLLTVLITSNGHVLAGAVTPAVLEAAAGQVK
jgi:outer membrane lipoprotein-sorting protein